MKIIFSPKSSGQCSLETSNTNEGSAVTTTAGCKVSDESNGFYLSFYISNILWWLDVFQKEHVFVSMGKYWKKRNRKKRSETANNRDDKRNKSNKWEDTGKKHWKFYFFSTLSSFRGGEVSRGFSCVIWVMINNFCQIVSLEGICIWWRGPSVWQTANREWLAMEKRRSVVHIQLHLEHVDFALESLIFKTQDPNLLIGLLFLLLNSCM